jgi:hypothetical protein
VTQTSRQRLRDAAHVLRAQRIDLQSLADAQGLAATHTLLVLLGALCLSPVPGVGTVLGLAVVALAAAMWRGHALAALPSRLAGFELSHRAARRVLRALVRVQALAERSARPRWRMAAVLLGERGAAGVIAVAGALIALPIPFGNLLPAAAVVCFGIALPRADGLLATLGCLLALAGLAWPLGLAAGALQVGAGQLGAWWPG